MNYLRRRLLGFRKKETIDKVTVKWANSKYKASIRYVPGNTELTYLDYQQKTMVYDLSIEEIAVGVEFGILPEPKFEIKQ